MRFGGAGHRSSDSLPQVHCSSMTEALFFSSSARRRRTDRANCHLEVAGLLFGMRLPRYPVGRRPDDDARRSPSANGAVTGCHATVRVLPYAERLRRSPRPGSEPPVPGGHSVASRPARSRHGVPSPVSRGLADPILWSTARGVGSAGRPVRASRRNPVAVRTGKPTLNAARRK